MARLAAIVPLFAGAVAAAGFAPFALWPLTLAAMAWLIGAVERAPGARAALLTGWLFGLGHFCAGNAWIAHAFVYQAAMPAALGVVAVVLLAAYLAIYPAIACLAAWLLVRRGGLALTPAFAACWIVAEIARGAAFTGFPWNPLGVVALGPFDRPGLARLAAWCGTYALSGLIVLLAGLWAGAWTRMRERRRLAAFVRAAIPVGLLLLPWRGEPADTPLAFTLVQPDIPEDQFNDPRRYEDQFRSLAALSARNAADGTGPRVVLWPEGVVPDYLREGYRQSWYDQTTYAGDPALARARLGRVIGADSVLMTGATDLASRSGAVTGAYNVITLIDHAGAIRGGYAKAHLVPYGEYLPMRDLLGAIGLSRLVSGDLDYLPGPGPQTIDLGDPARGGFGRAGFQICYEIVFSGHVIDPASRPAYLFNPSNDGWFGLQGPPQHLAQARLRAIEEGVPVLRSTTTGISAVIDAGGAVRQFIGPARAERRDGRVPASLPPTPFARAGLMLSLVWAAALVAAATVARRFASR